MGFVWGKSGVREEGLCVGRWGDRGEAWVGSASEGGCRALGGVCAEGRGAFGERKVYLGWGGRAWEWRALEEGGVDGEEAGAWG